MAAGNTRDGLWDCVGDGTVQVPHVIAETPTMSRTASCSRRRRAHCGGHCRKRCLLHGDRQTTDAGSTSVPVQCGGGGGGDHARSRGDRVVRGGVVAVQRAAYDPIHDASRQQGPVPVRFNAGHASQRDPSSHVEERCQNPIGCHALQPQRCVRCSRPVLPRRHLTQCFAQERLQGQPLSSSHRTRRPRRRWMSTDVTEAC